MLLAGTSITFPGPMLAVWAFALTDPSGAPAFWACAGAPAVPNSKSPKAPAASARTRHPAPGCRSCSIRVMISSSDCEFRNLSEHRFPQPRSLEAHATPHRRTDARRRKLSCSRRHSPWPEDHKEAVSTDYPASKPVIPVSNGHVASVRLGWRRTPSAVQPNRSIAIESLRQSSERKCSH